MILILIWILDIDSSVMYGEYYDLIQLMTAAVASVVAILVVLC